MKNLLILIALIALTHCTSVNQKYYDRTDNNESKLLNEYFEVIFKSSFSENTNLKVWLFDTLYPVSQRVSNLLIKWATDEKDSKIKEAFLDLSNSDKINIPINFSQLTNLKGLNLEPGYCDEVSYSKWNFSLSLPGYSKDSTIIAVQTSYYCGPLCAGVNIDMYKKENGIWIFIHRKNIMMA